MKPGMVQCPEINQFVQDCLWDRNCARLVIFHRRHFTSWRFLRVWGDILRVRSLRLMSAYLNAASSPQRSPQYPATTMRTRSLLESNYPASSQSWEWVSGWASFPWTFGRRIPVAGFRGIAPSCTAWSKTRRKTPSECRAVAGDCVRASSAAHPNFRRSNGYQWAPPERLCDPLADRFADLAFGRLRARWLCR